MSTGGNIGWLSWLGSNLGAQGSADTAKGGATLDKSKTDLGSVMNFWKDLMSGDRKKTMSVLAPQIGTISSQYQAARKAAAENAPRSGGRAAMLEESRQKEGGDIQNLLEQGQIAGAEGLTKAVGIETAIGSTQAQIGLNETASGINSVSDALSSMLQKKQIDNASGASLGQGIGQALAMAALMAA